MTPPTAIADLVSRFDRNRDSYRSAAYNEEQLRAEFLNPLFIALGWDVYNTSGFAEPYKDVVFEQALKIGGGTKAPDYCFRIAGARKFFLEAKKPSLDLKDDPGPAFQLRRYAWSAKLPLSILSDFEEFAVYDCRLPPAPADPAARGRILYLTYDAYLDRWPEIAGVFSKDAVLKGSFDKFAETTKKKKGAEEVDSAFLKQIESWRETLAKNIALRNPKLSNREMNFAVQQTLDRIVFLRICEDRGIENYGQLQSLQNGNRVYPRLFQLFETADDKYNSGLFNFRQEKDRPAPDALTPKLDIDDKILKDILKSLYYPDSPYEFSVLPADILGQVYEQFLGKVIRLTAGHQAKVEAKPEVKKAGGVYYTPTYIVDYIVKNTVGKLLEGRCPADVAQGFSPGEGLAQGFSPGKRGKVSGPEKNKRKKGGADIPVCQRSGRADIPVCHPLRILDPACGSGSFLLGAYQYLLDWYLDQYLKDGPEKHQDQIYQFRASVPLAPRLAGSTGASWRLTTSERKRILLDHIYGVDIDQQAVEVTKLSLLLKCLEGETEQSIHQLKLFYKQRALPDLSANIKCGNSLIGSDFYHNQQMTMFSEEERYHINIFDWKAGFPEVFKDDNPGFDSVIGNPPYVRQEMISQFKDYFQQNYRTYHGMADIYVFFIERGLNLINNGGIFSYIVMSKWLRTKYGETLRSWLKQQCIEEIINFCDLAVFQKATTYPCILRVSKQSPGATFQAAQVSSLEFGSLSDFVSKASYSINQSSLDNKAWSLAKSSDQVLMAKLESTGIPLRNYIGRNIYYGIKTGFNEAFVIDQSTRDQLISQHSKSIELLKPFLVGKDIKRYQPLVSDRYLIFTRRGVNIKDYPAIENHLLKFKDRLMPKPKNWKGSQWNGRKPGEYKWFEIQDTIDYYREFEKPKIIWPGISSEVTAFALDEEGYYGNDNNQLIISNDKYLLGLLNSSLSRFYLKNVCDRVQGGFYRLKIIYIEQIPIFKIALSDSLKNIKYQNIIELVDNMLNLYKRLILAKVEHDREVLRRQLAATDAEIDGLVYELYGLTEEEIKIVEGR